MAASGTENASTTAANPIGSIRSLLFFSNLLNFMQRYAATLLDVPSIYVRKGSGVAARPKVQDYLLGGLIFHALVDDIIGATGIRGGRTMCDLPNSAGRVLDFIRVALAAPFFERYSA